MTGITIKLKRMLKTAAVQKWIGNGANLHRTTRSHDYLTV